MSDASEQATDTGNRRSVERAATFQHLSADTAIVDFAHGMVSISFLLESSRTSGVQWQHGDPQPDRYYNRRVVEELASMRMAPDAANALALDILLEIAVSGMSLDKMEKNFAIVRSAVAKRLNNSQAEDKNA